LKGPPWTSGERTLANCGKPATALHRCFAGKSRNCPSVDLRKYSQNLLIMKENFEWFQGVTGADKTKIKALSAFAQNGQIRSPPPPMVCSA
jgi:hypothetical protein